MTRKNVRVIERSRVMEGIIVIRFRHIVVCIKCLFFGFSLFATDDMALLSSVSCLKCFECIFFWFSLVGSFEYPCFIRRLKRLSFSILFLDLVLSKPVSC